MWFGPYLWLLLCYAQYAKGHLLDDYERLTQDMLSPPEDKFSVALPIHLAKDAESGCMCKASKNLKVVICFGNYECKKFPKVKIRGELLMIRTTVIREIRVGELDYLYYLNTLKLDANHQLSNIQEGAFRNLTNLQKLSISYSMLLHTLHKKLFEGLVNLRDLTLVSDGFTNIAQITIALTPSILPSLRKLDLSENPLEVIPESAFSSMEQTKLEILNIELCGLDYIHSNSFTPLKMLKDLNIGQNDLNSSIIGDFLLITNRNNINLTKLDLSGLGFRRQLPRHLLDIIANTTIQKLILSDNQFEIIPDNAFPRMVNIELIDLRRVSALSIGPNVFEPKKFPNLKILLLGGNNLPGIHLKNVSNGQVIFIDLSGNKGTSATPMYYDIDKGSFSQSRELRVLNLAYNRLKAIYDYTFRGLTKLKILNLENGTLYYIGNGTFKPLKYLEILNLANNPLTANGNLTSAMFDGLSELKILILKNCGIKHLYDNDNIFEKTPNLTHLILSNNQLYYITDETLKPLKFLRVLDLSGNLLVSWWKPLFLGSGVRPTNLYLTNNKITQFTLSMIQDINYLLKNKDNYSVVIDLLENVFVCDCISMYKTYLWLQVNGSDVLRQYFANSHFLCSSPDIWEDRRVADYLSSIKTLRCLMYEKISNIMVLVWTAPSIVSFLALAVVAITVYKYRIYIRYWFFLAKIALGRKLIKRSARTDNLQGNTYKFDAFISYCNEDREFVSEMISQLECTPPYLKLCVYERDFEIGSFISESILGSINDSKFIILIISEHFAKSQWCRWETQLAEYHRLFLEDGTSYDPLVLVRVGHLDNKYLSTTLKYLLKTKIYLSWNEQHSEEFWRKLRNLLTKNR